MRDDDIPEAKPIPPRPTHTEPAPSSGEMTPKMAVAVGLVGVLAVGGMLAFAISRQMPGAGEPEVTHDYFREPALPRALLAEEVGSPVRAHSLRYLPTLVGAYGEQDGRYRRYTVYDDGRVMRRGGAGSPPGTPPFDLSTVELEALPRILRAARESVDGPEPSSVTLARADDGAVVWHVVLWTNEGSREVQVALDGTVRSDTDVRAPVEVHPEDL